MITFCAVRHTLVVSIRRLPFSLFVLMAACFGIHHASLGTEDPGAIENRWKLGDVRKEYEEQAQLKVKENRQAWRKQQIESTGIAWSLGDTVAMIRGDGDPMTTEIEDCVLDSTQSATECVRLVVEPVRSELNNIVISVSDFRSVAGVVLPAEAVVRSAESQRDGAWRLSTPVPADRLSPGHRRQYIAFLHIPESAFPDEYFGRVVVTAANAQNGKAVCLAVPLRLIVRRFREANATAHMGDRTKAVVGESLGDLSANNSMTRTALFRAEYDRFQRYLTMLGKEIKTNLPGWAKTGDDKQFVHQCEATQRSCLAIELSDVAKRADFQAIKKNLAAKLEHAILVLRCDLHNVTIGETNTPGHTILNSAMYVPHPGELVVVYPDSIYKSDAVFQSKGISVISKDNGLTWTPYDAAKVGNLDQAAVLPPDGKRRIETFSYGWENHPESDRAQLEAKGFYIFDVKDGNIPGVLSICYHAGMKRSRDGGATWETKEIALPRFMPDLRAHMGGIALRDGAYLYPMYGRYDMKKEKYISSLVLRTANAGDSWEIHTIANAMNGYFDKTARGEKANGFNETSLVEAPNGDVVAVIRTNDQIELWTATSKDGGKTWSEPRDSGMRGSVPFCVATTDGYLVCIHSRREKRIFPDGTGMYAGISNDNGKTWHSICIEDGAMQFVDSYAQAVALPDGRVFTAYTAPRNGRQASCGTLFTPGRWMSKQE